MLLFFLLCGVELSNGNQVHEIGEYVNYQQTVSSFDLVNQQCLCFGLCEGFSYLHDNEFLHRFLSHKNVKVNGPFDNVVVFSETGDIYAIG